MPDFSTPSRSVHIAAASATCSLGPDLDAIWERLCRGESAVGPVERFSTDALDYHEAACMVDLDALPPSRSRILELLGRALKPLPSLPENTRLIWTGVKGNAEWVESEISDRDSCFFYPEQYRRWIADSLGIEAVGFDLNAACASSTAGLAIGAQMIASGECESVLVCAADIVSRFTFTGFSALKALSRTVCRPFDAGRDGLVLGDGAAAILLVSREAARGADLPLLARLSGWGIANDANHITGPARDGCGLIAAFQSAIDQAGVDAGDVEAFCAHGTGTVYNDAMELTAVETLFARRPFPLFSIKGAIGHTLGAAGAIEVGVCLRALREKT
ncbi:beta-ketoacyl-[acyl-carrier-protein] synthase family protein, partial [bacterium]|nr:beta-ketoacyl-[acyl-carrier-protein] synthase family protein [bacterium]